MRKQFIVRTTLAGALALVIASGGFYGYTTMQPALTSQAAVLASPATPSAAIVAEARVVPIRNAELSFGGSGVLAELLVHAGDQVAVGQPLARLDSASQQARVAQAEADLEKAQAALARLHAPATEEAVAQVEAQVQAAQARLQQANGSVTPADRAVAQARLAEAQARLAQARRGARPAVVAEQQARVAQQEAGLVAERDRLSVAKTDAYHAMQQAVDRLTKAQSAWVIASKEWETVQQSHKHPTLDYRMGEAERRTFYDAFIQAQAELRSTEAAVEQARVAYDAARAAEVTGVQQAEQRVAETRAQLSDLEAGSEADVVAAAETEVAAARAELEQLGGEQRGGELAAAGAELAAAEADLAGLQAGATLEQIAEAEAEVHRAEAALVAAQVALRDLELRAPFAGVIAAVDGETGEYVTPETVVVRLGDTSAWTIETSDLTELSIVQVAEGAPVVVTFDALPGLIVPGTVTGVRSFGENRQGDITYTVSITPDAADVRLRWNMTAAVSIEPQ
jgi:HlyD family secretion protein